MKVKEESEKVILKLNIQETKIMSSGPITSWEIDGESVETVIDFIWRGLQNHCRWWLQPWNQKTLTLWKKSYDQPRQHIKKQEHCFANKSPSSQSYGFSSSQVWMWELNHKVEHQRTDAFELWCWRRLDSPLDCREINLEYSLEELMQKLQYFGHLMQRTDIGKDPDAGQDWRQEEKGMTEDEMVAWHHWYNGH